MNKSDVPVSFEWRAFATEKEDRDRKNRLLAQLDKEEQEELLQIDVKDVD